MSAFGSKADMRERHRLRPEADQQFELIRFGILTTIC